MDITQLHTRAPGFIFEEIQFGIRGIIYCTQSRGISEREIFFCLKNSGKTAKICFCLGSVTCGPIKSSFCWYFEGVALFFNAFWSFFLFIRVGADFRARGRPRTSRVGRPGEKYLYLYFAFCILYFVFGFGFYWSAWGAPPATRKVYWGRNGPSLELIFSSVSY